MATYIFRGGAYLWTAQYSFFAPENSQGEFIYYNGPPGPGDIVYFGSEPTLDSVAIVGETLNTQSFAQDTIQDSSFDTGTTLFEADSSMGDGFWNNTVLGSFDTGATMNIGNAATFGEAAFLLVQPGGVGELPSIINTGTINLDNGYVILNDSGPAGAEVAGVFDNFNLVRIQYTGSQASSLSDQLVGGTDGFVNAGTVVVDGGSGTGHYSAYAFFSGGVGGDGTMTVANGALEFEQDVSAGQTIEFEDANGYMGLGTSDLSSGAFQGTIEGFRPGDTIDLGTAASSIDPSVVGEIRVLNNLDLVGTLHLTAAPGSNTFALGQGTNGDGLLEMVPACYAAGTRILSDRGEVAVENLRAGNRVMAHAGDGRMVPHQIVWIGHRHVDCGRHPKPKTVWPVRVTAGAFGDRVPHRDLYLSPDHAVFVDGVLVPIRCLVDGDAIDQVPAARVTYFHVELSTHAVLLAEGLPAESFLDAGSRAAFDNGGGAVQLHPDFAARRWDADGCAPLVVAGPKLDQVRAGLRERLRAVLGVGRAGQQPVVPRPQRR
jgi:hypothetical protein